MRDGAGLFTSSAGLAIWSKLGAAPPGWLASKAGRDLCAKSLRILRERGEKQDAKTLRNLLTVAVVIDKVFSA